MSCTSCTCSELESDFVEQAGLEPMILQPWHPKRWGYRCRPPHLAASMQPCLPISITGMFSIMHKGEFCGHKSKEYQVIEHSPVPWEATSRGVKGVPKHKSKKIKIKAAWAFCQVVNHPLGALWQGEKMGVWRCSCILCPHPSPAGELLVPSEECPTSSTNSWAQFSHARLTSSSQAMGQSTQQPQFWGYPLSCSFLFQL